ncbi:MAG: proton-conducting transporter membrane subunit [Planctomycetota bacterium]
MERALPLFVIVPLAVSFLLPLLDKVFRRGGLTRFVAGLTALALLVLSLHFLGTPDTVAWIGKWSFSARGATGISLVSDDLARLMLVVINGIGFAAVLFSLSYMRRYTSPSLYFTLFFLMMTGMNGVVITGDLFNLFVFLEIAAIASYALVGFGCESEELEAAFKYLVLGTIGSAFVLLAIGILYNQTGFLNMAQVAQILAGAPLNRLAVIAAAFFLLGFGLKAAMVPWHAWLPDAHPSAPAPISAMLSGVLIKALGVYAMARVFFHVIPIRAEFAWAIMTMGALSMVIGVFLAVGQWDFKRLLAYHSISQMGYVVLALGVAAEMALRKNYFAAAVAASGGLFHMFNHAAFKSLLFLCSGATEYATGTRQLKELGGVKDRLPLTGACLRIAALSISGVPPMNGFWSKLMIVIALVLAGHLWLAAMTVLVSFMTLLSFVKVQRYVLEGDPSARVADAIRVPLTMRIAMALLAVVCVGAGVLFPFYGDRLIEAAGNGLVLPAQNYIAKVLGGG